VERLCTYQYSLVSLIPSKSFAACILVTGTDDARRSRLDLLLALEDAASPNLDKREKNTTRATELKTSDRNSMMKYLGLPLNVFGKVLVRVNPRRSSSRVDRSL